MNELKHLPAWRYHAEHAAKILYTQAEIDEAEAQGWRDSPGAAAAAIPPILKNGDTFTIAGQVTSDGRLRQFVADDGPFRLPTIHLDAKPAKKRKKVSK